MITQETKEIIEEPEISSSSSDEEIDFGPDEIPKPTKTPSIEWPQNQSTEEHSSRVMGGIQS